VVCAVHRREDNGAEPGLPAAGQTKVPLEIGAQRLIIATCEKGTVENIDDMRQIKGGLDKIKKENPNFVEVARQSRVSRAGFAAGGRRAAQVSVHRGAEEARRVDEEALGNPHRHAARAQHVFAGAGCSRATSRRWASRAEKHVFSEYTNEELYKEGANAGPSTRASPPNWGFRTYTTCCSRRTRRSPLDIIFFPMIDCLTTELYGGSGQPLVPHGGRHAGSGEGGVRQGGQPLHRKGYRLPGHLRQHLKPELLERQLYEEFKDVLGAVSRGEPQSGSGRLPRPGFLQ